jgi:hypothetical protein
VGVGVLTCRASCDDTYRKLWGGVQQPATHRAGWLQLLHALKQHVFSLSDCAVLWLTVIVLCCAVLCCAVLRLQTSLPALTAGSTAGAAR